MKALKAERAENGELKRHIAALRDLLRNQTVTVDIIVRSA